MRVRAESRERVTNNIPVMLSNATARPPTDPTSDVPPLRLRATYPRSASPGPRAPRGAGVRRPPAGRARRNPRRRNAVRAGPRTDLARLACRSRCGAPGRRYFNKTTNLRLPFKVNLRALRYRKRSDLFRRTYRLLPGPRLARAPTRGFYDGRVRRRSASGPARRRSAAAVAARRPAPRPRWPFGRPRRRAVPCGVPD